MKLVEKLKWKRLWAVEERADLVIKDIKSRLLEVYCGSGKREVVYPVNGDYAQDEIIIRVVDYFSDEGLDVSFEPNVFKVKVPTKGESL